LSFDKHKIYISFQKVFRVPLTKLFSEYMIDSNLFFSLCSTYIASFQ